MLAWSGIGVLTGGAGLLMWTSNDSVEGLPEEFTPHIKAILSPL